MRASISTDGIRIGVTDHAMWRAAERFPRFDTALIEGEVRAALQEGRVARTKPPAGFSPYREGLYAWTPDVLRCYVLEGHADAYVVISTLRADATSGPRGRRAS